MQAITMGIAGWEYKPAKKPAAKLLKETWERYFAGEKIKPLVLEDVYSCEMDECFRVRDEYEIQGQGAFCVQPYVPGGAVILQDGVVVEEEPRGLMLSIRVDELVHEMELTKVIMHQDNENRQLCFVNKGRKKTFRLMLKFAGEEDYRAAQSYCYTALKKKLDVEE